MGETITGAAAPADRWARRARATRSLSAAMRLSGTARADALERHFTEFAAGGRSPHTCAVRPSSSVASIIASGSPSDS